MIQNLKRQQWHRSRCLAMNVISPFLSSKSTPFKDSQPNFLASPSFSSPFQQKPFERLNSCSSFQWDPLLSEQLQDQPLDLTASLSAQRSL